MLNPKNSSLSINKNPANCVSGTQSPTSQILFKQFDMICFIETHCDSVLNGKMLYFPWYFGDLDRVETGVSEKGIKSLKTLLKLS